MFKYFFLVLILAFTLSQKGKAQYFGGIGSGDHYSQSEAPAPVELNSFSYITTSNGVNLFWQTSEEINNSGFEIERKSGNEIWEKIGFVKGNNKPAEYNFEDRNLKTGKYNYRLKQIDYNGNYEFFELKDLIEIAAPGKFGLSQNYPNPFNPTTNLNYQIATKNFVKLIVYDITGREVATLVNEYKEPGYYSVLFNAAKLTAGIYFYRIIAGDFSSVKKIILLK